MSWSDNIIQKRTGIRAAGASVACAHGDDFGTGAMRYLRRIVGRATVGHDHGINEMARQCRDDGADRLGFVERRNHNGRCL